MLTCGSMFFIETLFVVKYISYIIVIQNEKANNNLEVLDGLDCV